MATAVWLAQAGHRVTLVEKRGRLGGRTISFGLPGIEGGVDNGQHLLAGGRRGRGVAHSPRATFSAQPGFDEPRLPQGTPIDGLFLAGDWTETGMPSTMEAAAESAVRAVGAVGEYLGARRPVIDLK